MLEIKINTYYENSRSEILNLIPKNIKSLLDVGCGEGNFLKSVEVDTKAEVWGVELLPEIANKAKDLTDNILIGKIEDVLSSLPNDYFDCITFNDVLEHLIQPWDVLEQIMPKLTHNGVIVASIPNVRYIYNLQELLIKKDWEYKEAGILDSTHFRFFTKKSIIRMVKKSGYEIVTIKGINKANSWKFKLLNLLSLGNLNDTGFMQFACVLKKKVVNKNGFHNNSQL